MGDFKCLRHLKQVLWNVQNDARLSADEKIRASRFAQDQYDRLEDGTESTPSTWDSAIQIEIHALSRAPEELRTTTLDAKLGNVVARASFERAVVFTLACSYAEASRLVDLLVQPRSRLSRDELEEVDEMRESIRLRSTAVWLFQDETSLDDPYLNQQLEYLPCRLGLPYAAGEDIIGFVVPLTVIAPAHRPCVYEVGWFFQEFWRPGGHTKPICSSRSFPNGLSEWITAPPRLIEIEERFVSGTVADGFAPGTEAYD